VRIIALSLLLTAACAYAADFTIWRASDVKAKERELAGKATPQRMASETLENYGNHLTMLAVRRGNGEPEIHEKMADIFVIESGEATLLVGGKANGAKTTAPGELRGGTIEGGQKQKLAPGDIVHIPPGVPHQVLLDSGGTFTYFVVKVESAR
jgi:mannose-6-phosphate isomerase-like protein (cupin superfamily)